LTYKVILFFLSILHIFPTFINVLTIPYCNLVGAVDCDYFLHEHENSLVLLISLKLAKSSRKK